MNNADVIRVAEVICHFSWIVENEIYCPTDGGQNLHIFIMPSGLRVRGSSHFLQCVLSCGFLLWFFGVFLPVFVVLREERPPSIPAG